MNPAAKLNTEEPGAGQHTGDVGDRGGVMCQPADCPAAMNNTDLPIPCASTCSSSAAIASFVPAAAAMAMSPMFSMEE